jgi:hypothetical protein
MLNKKLNGVTAPPSDPYFENVSLLLQGDGTNGAQNNTFLDSSTNNFTITRNGNTTQGSFSPYGNLWSNYFDGSGDYLSVANNAALSFGTGDFTMECWISPASQPSSFNAIIGTSATGGPILNLRGSGTSTSIGLNSYGSADIFNISYTFTQNVWTHIAVTRSGTSLKLFINGTQTGSTVTNSTNFSGYVTSIAMADNGNQYFNGYISNARIVKGTALYTSNFTPSTTPLTAVSGTSLLTCQSNRFIDNSSNNFAITVNGNTSVQRFSPFNPTAAYDPAAIGGSGYFDGSSNLATASLPSMTDFTAEAWFYLTSATTNNQNAISIGGALILGFFNSTNNDVLRFACAGVTTPITGLPTKTSLLNTWNHVAMSRSGSSVSCYLNGTRVATLTAPNTVGSGSYILGSGFVGYVSNARVVKGTALYSGATISVPTAPLTAITNTNLLCNFTNAGIPDAAMMNDLETVGNAQVSTSVKKYGTGSLAFDGTGDYLYSVTSPNLSVGTGDFTIECWAYFNSVSGFQVLFDLRSAQPSSAPLLYIAGNSRLNYLFNSGTPVAFGPNPLSTSTWYHIAWVRSGTTHTLYVNGVSQTTFTDGTGTATSPVTIGARTTGGASDYLNGYIDDLRITKGYARYTANFTPPAQALPNQ